MQVEVKGEVAATGDAGWRLYVEDRIAYEMPAHLPWRGGADLQTGNQLSYFKHFYTSLEWWKLVPHFSYSPWSSFPRRISFAPLLRRGG
jgi:hypothetical protein